MQVPVEKESRKFLTITTHIGLYKYTKMTEGIASAPAEFQQIMDGCLQGIPNTIAYMDNIFVTGKHTKNTSKIYTGFVNDWPSAVYG